MASPWGPYSTPGTAPRRVGGVWYTATGRKLTAAGQKFWTQQWQLGVTDGNGHYNHQLGQVAHQARLGATPAVRQRAGRQLGAAAKRQQRALGGGLGQAARIAYAGTPIGAIQHAVRHPSPRSVGAAIPVFGPNFDQGIDTIQSGRRAAGAVRRGQLPGAADTLALAGLFPGFRGESRAVRAARLAKGASEAENAAVAQTMRRVAPYISNRQEEVGGLLDTGTIGQRGYVYHRTTPEAFASIQEQGLTPRTPVGNHGGIPDLPGVYFSTQPLRTTQFVNEARNSIFLRAREDNLPGLALHPNKAYGEMISPHAVPPEHLEYFGKDGVWHPVLTPEERLLRARPAAMRNIAETRAAQSAARRERTAQIGPAFQAAGGGMKGHLAAKARLRGPLSDIHFDALRDLTQEDLDHLTNVVHSHPELREFEKIRLVDAIDRAKRGKGFRTSDLKLIDKAFGQDVAREAARVGKIARSLHRGAVELLNLPRTLQTTLDASFGLRQGIAALAYSPRTWAKAYGRSLGHLGSEGLHQADMAAIEAHPHFDMWKQAGLKMTDLGSDVAQREEGMISTIATHGKFNPVRMSGRSYVGATNMTRFGSAEHLYAKALAKGETDTVGLRHDIARLANVLTGRGGLGRLESAGPLMNTVFFAPRLTASRVELIRLAFGPGVNKFVRREAQKTLVKMGAAGAAVLEVGYQLGGGVNLDPTNADFGKLKIGNTRIDIWAGFQQPVRLINQIAQGKVTSSTTGKTIKLQGGIGHLSRKDVIERFARTKMAPVAGTAYDAAAGRDFVGNPFSLTGAVKQWGVPFGVQDTLDTYRQTHSIPKAAAAWGGTAIGVGIQSYGPKKKSPTKSRSRAGHKQKDWYVGGSSGGSRGGAKKSSRSKDWFVG